MRRALLVFALVCAAPASAAEPDPWFGPDKALHFTLSAALSGGGYGAAAWLEQPPVLRLVIGGAVGVSAGVAKELYDLARGGEVSARDLAWDAIGVTTGLLVAFAIDLLWSQLADGDGAGTVELHAREARQRITWDRDPHAQW